MHGRAHSSLALAECRGQSNPVGRNALPLGLKHLRYVRDCVKHQSHFTGIISQGSPEITAAKETGQWAAHEVIKRQRQRQDLKPGLLDAATYPWPVQFSLQPTLSHRA